MEDCDWIKTLVPKEVIIRFSRGKDADKVRTEKKKLKGKTLTSPGINKPIYVNDSLWTYYEKLWAKCKKLCDNKVIHAFWISNGSIKLKFSETCNALTVSQDVDLGHTKNVGFPFILIFYFYFIWVSWSGTCVHCSY